MEVAAYSLSERLWGILSLREWLWGILSLREWPGAFFHWENGSGAFSHWEKGSGAFSHWENGSGAFSHWENVFGHSPTERKALGLSLPYGTSFIPIMTRHLFFFKLAIFSTWLHVNRYENNSLLINFFAIFSRHIREQDLADHGAMSAGCYHSPQSPFCKIQ